MKEERKPSQVTNLDDAKKAFLEDDLNDLEFEIEELETRLAFMVPTDGGGGCLCEDCSCAPH